MSKLQVKGRQQRGVLRVDDLSAKHQMIVAGVVAGKSNAHIGMDLDLMPTTVAAYLQTIYERTGARGRVALVQWAHGIAMGDDPPHTMKTCLGDYTKIPESEIIRALPRVKNKQAILQAATNFRAEVRTRSADRRTAEIQDYERRQKIMEPRRLRSPRTEVRDGS